ncbi:MAG: hypothetical protein FWC66_02665 [Oscillospiraceae bacterium]|nr:hypothetical protein [Oscillospiraceae bacterium]
MKKSIYKKSGWDVLRSAVLPLLFTVAVMLVIVYGLHQTEQSGRAEAKRVLEDSIRRAVVTAYAIEGRYPESIAYIEEHFEIHIDWSRFIVHYHIFASNVFPDIAVIEL